MPQFSLSWDAYKQNICSGLSTLQQNGEFVDMTLAADGHHVKVHRMVMSLVSPYIKDLITSAQCPHPVIFLNKVSYATLCAILEYIYTGEVMVDKEKMVELVQAGKELHIMGLQDMHIELADQNLSQAALASSRVCEGQPLSERGRSSQDPESRECHNTVQIDSRVTGTEEGTAMPIAFVDAHSEHVNNDSTFEDAVEMYSDTDTDTKTTSNINNKKVVSTKTTSISDNSKDAQIQYTISNCGSLQIILNRFVYNLRYKSTKDNGVRRWRCAQTWGKIKCTASVITNGNIVVKRIQTHNHPFHDVKILKKVQDNNVYSTLTDALDVVQHGGLNRKHAKSV